MLEAYKANRALRYSGTDQLVLSSKFETPVFHCYPSMVKTALMTAVRRKCDIPGTNCNNCYLSIYYLYASNLYVRVHTEGHDVLLIYSNAWYFTLLCLCSSICRSFVCAEFVCRSCLLYCMYHSRGHTKIHCTSVQWQKKALSYILDVAIFKTKLQGF